MLSVVGQGAWAQNTKFPIFDNQRLPRPTDISRVEADNFKIDLTRINRYPDGMVYGDQPTLRRLGNYLLNDAEGKAMWKKQAENTANVVNQWDLNRTGFAANRYIYSIVQLENLSLVYMLTGQRDLGQFIRAHLLHITELPYEFWVHAELRGYNPKLPLGMIETAAVCTGVSVALSATGALFSPDEKARVESALRNKGLQTCLNWLKTPSLSNFTAVISSGAFVAARYFNDNDAKEKARQAMIGYLNGSIEKDGSYGEGTGYFNYPIGSILSAVLSMTEAERQSTFSSSGLRYSSQWEVYPYLFNTSQAGKLEPTVIHYGDNAYSSSPSIAVNQLLSSLYQDSLAAWLIKKFDRNRDFREALLAFSVKGDPLTPKSPEQSRLPLLKVFNSGDCYIRSTWADNGIVLGMRSGDGSLIKFNHQRAELHSIGLGAYGEYLVVSPGSASYRSPLHYMYDYTTRAANTITIDDKNQRFPGKGLNSWSKGLDNSAFWVSGKPKAEVILSKAGDMADLLVSEAASAYAPTMKQARRSVLFVRDPGYFVIVDRLEVATDSTHKFSYRLHLNNRDGKGKLAQKSDSHWQFERPQADLGIHVFANTMLSSTIGEGYMHGSERDYSPGGENEGKLGSAIELTVSNKAPTAQMTFYSVLFPTKKGGASQPVQHTANTISIGKDKLVFDEQTYRLTKNGRTETFNMP
ncbi:hypothetical protein GCM10028807_12050 [Spirosoma daeguense]